MKAKVILTLLAVFFVLSATVSAQDGGERDTLILQWVHTPDVEIGDSAISWEIVSWSDVNLGNLSAGFEWSGVTMIVDTAYLSPVAASTFTSLQILFANNDIDSTNDRQEFQAVLGGMALPGLASGRQNLVTYEGHVTEFGAGDSIVIDTADFTSFLFVEGWVNEYPPHYGGRLIFGYPEDVTDLGQSELPTSWELAQNYPNPFNPTTQISFDVPRRAKVNLSIFNVLGQRVATLIDEEMEPQHHTVNWAGTTDGGSQVASGIYFYRLSAGEMVKTKKMMLLK